MTRFKGEIELKVMINLFNLTCCKCKHLRKNEPYVREGYWPTVATHRTKYTCWRCLRDAESTLLIKQKWPLAFDRVEYPVGFILYWAPGIEVLVGGNDESEG